MEFRILGALEVAREDGPLALGGPRQRAVLAHLILRANHVVPADLLIDGLWGEEPPETARNTLQTYVYRLRKLLGDGRLEGRDGGYVLRAASEEIDALRFEAMVKQAKQEAASDPGGAAGRFAEALALWRGSALADLAKEPSLRGEIARLEELRLSATERKIAAEIAMGGHSTVVSDLEALTARYPLRERMWANLMLALYRLGRQAEALSTYQRARTVLAEELGAEPSDELQRLNEQILRRDPALGRRQPRPAAVRPSRIDLPPGTEFAGYRIERTLGRGGMSVVYLAEHDWLQRKVALKVLAPQLAEDERFRERFVRESRLAASLDHPNVIPIYEAGGSGGDLFIAMRYVEGTDLRTHLQEAGALEPARAVAIVRQVAAALDAAHEQGLVHRDVKPGNVLLARARTDEDVEHVYLSDFGLTKRSASDSGITGTGQFVGTLDYAAPEQFTGGAPDPRTDVYSLGCVLFECLVGHPPFRADNDASIMYAHLQDDPPSLTDERPDLPPQIDPVVAKAMAKEPDDRHQSAGALVKDVVPALGLGVEVWGPAPARGGRLRVLAGALGIALALVAGVVLSSVFRGEAPLPEGERTAAPSASPSPSAPPNFRTVDRPLVGEEERLLGYVPGELATDCQPLDRPEPVQGELAALVCRTEDVEVLYELFPTRDLMDAAFQQNANSTQAPDGDCGTDRVAVGTYTIDGRTGGRVLCYTVKGGLARAIAGIPDTSHIEWTDENSSIYAHAVRNDLGDLTLHEWWLADSGPVLGSGSEAVIQKDRSSASGARLRDGSYLTSPPRGCAGFKGVTCAMLVEGESYRLIFTDVPGDTAETGRLLLQKPNAVVFTPETGYCFGGELLGPPRSPVPAVFEWVARADTISFERVSGGGCAGPQKLGGPWTRAPSGTIAFELNGEITLMEPGGFGVEQLATDVASRHKDPDWSPDGSQIVFAGTGANNDLFVMDADGTGITRLTEDPGDEYDPAWSPDGGQIAFGFDDLGFPQAGGFKAGIALIDSSGGEWRELVLRKNERLGWPAWSPDGRRIAFSAESGDSISVYVVDADGTNLLELYRGPRSVFAMPVAWSPEGDRIVFWGEEKGKETLLSMRPNGSDVRPLLPHLPPEASTLTVDWSPDERWIVAAAIFDLTSFTADPSLVYLIRADGSEVFTIGPSGSEPSWRPEAD